MTISKNSKERRLLPRSCPRSLLFSDLARLPSMKPLRLIALLVFCAFCSAASVALGQTSSTERTLTTVNLDNEEQEKAFNIASSEDDLPELSEITDLLDDEHSEGATASKLDPAAQETMQILARGIQAAVFLISMLALYKTWKTILYVSTNIYTRRHRWLVAMLGGQPPSEDGIEAAHLRAKLQIAGFSMTLVIFPCTGIAIYWIGASQGL